MLRDVTTRCPGMGNAMVLGVAGTATMSPPGGVDVVGIAGVATADVVPAAPVVALTSCCGGSVVEVPVAVAACPASDASGTPFESSGGSVRRVVSPDSDAAPPPSIDSRAVRDGITTVGVGGPAHCATVNPGDTGRESTPGPRPPSSRGAAPPPCMCGDSVSVATGWRAPKGDNGANAMGLRPS